MSKLDKLMPQQTLSKLDKLMPQPGSPLDSLMPTGQQADILRTPEQAEQEAGEAFDLAAEHQVPLDMVADYFHQIKQEADDLGVTGKENADPQSLPLGYFSPEAREQRLRQNAYNAKLDKQITLWEQIRRMDATDWLDLLPFSPASAARALDVQAAVRRLQEDKYEDVVQAERLHAVDPWGTGLQYFGDPAHRPTHDAFGTPLPTAASRKDGDIRLVAEYFLRQQEEAERGLTFGAEVFQGATYLPKWAIEFAATGGLGKIGGGLAEKAALRVLRGYAGSVAGRTVLYSAGWTAEAVARSFGMPNHILEAAAKRNLPDQISLDDTGKFTFKIDKENWATSVAMGWLSTVVSTWSELAGERLFIPAGKALLNRLPFTKRLVERMQHSWLANHSNQTVKDFQAFLARAGYSNLPSELGEEVIEPILHAIAGTEDYGADAMHGGKATRFQRIVAALKADWNHLGATAATLSLFPMAKVALRVAAGSAPTPSNAKDSSYWQAVRDAMEIKERGGKAVQEGPQKSASMDVSAQQQGDEAAPGAEAVPAGAEEAVTPPSPNSTEYGLRKMGLLADLNYRFSKVRSMADLQAAMAQFYPDELTYFGIDPATQIYTAQSPWLSTHGEEATQFIHEQFGLVYPVTETAPVVEDSLTTAEQPTNEASKQAQDQTGPPLFDAPKPHRWTYGFQAKLKTQIAEALGLPIETMDVPLPQWANIRDSYQHGEIEQAKSLAEEGSRLKDTSAGKEVTSEDIVRYQVRRQLAPSWMSEDVKEQWAWGLIDNVEAHAASQEVLLAREDAGGALVEIEEADKAATRAMDILRTAAQAGPDDQPLRDDSEERQQILDMGAFESEEAVREFLGRMPDGDVPELPGPSDNDIKLYRRVLRGLNLDDSEWRSEKDFHDIYKYVQMPDDIRRSFPAFNGLYKVQRDRETLKHVMDRQFGEATKPYFTLSHKSRKAIDKVLLAYEQNPNTPMTAGELGSRGLDQDQIAGFFAIREALDKARDILIQRMRDAGVKEEVIADFSRETIHYVPHKWYGGWGIVVRAIPTEAEVKAGMKGKTLWLSATTRAGRNREYKRLQAAFPEGVTFHRFKRSKIPMAAFQEAPSVAVQSMVEKVIEKAHLPKEYGAVLEAVKADLFKAKGFGMHFIKRKGVRGFSEDLTRPLAEYFTGFSGYVSKMEAIQKFPQALAAIDAERQPNLYQYGLDYIQYVTGDIQEYNGLKTIAYLWYLYGNPKSATMQLTQNYIMAWPVLSKHTNFPLARLLLAQAAAARPSRLLSAEHKAWIAALEETGALGPMVAESLRGIAGNPIWAAARSRTRKIAGLFDIFKHMEIFNRRAMAIALYDAHFRDPQKARELIEQAHYYYGKGNRPVLSRGRASPLMTFRSYAVNFLTWQKNNAKEAFAGPDGKTRTKALSAGVRSATAYIFFTGLRGVVGYSMVAGVYRHLYGRDLEGDAREWMAAYLGNAGRLAAKGLFNGVPAVATPVSLSGSLSLDETLPKDFKDVFGVWADLFYERPKRAMKSWRSGDMGRLFEDLSPEFLRNPLAAMRLHTDGQTLRNGQPILDPETFGVMHLDPIEAAGKALGFNPDRMAEQIRMQATPDALYKDINSREGMWADRLSLAVMNRDDEAVKDTLADIDTYIRKMVRRNRSDEVAGLPESIERRLKARMKVLNIPSERMMPIFMRIRNQYYGSIHESHR